MVRQEEGEAIMDVIASESAAFWNKDFNAWAQCWVQEEYVRFMGWWAAGGATAVEGWSKLSALMKETMEANPIPNPSAYDVRREQINLQMRGDVAWVTYNQYGADTGDARMDMPGLSRETKILEKHEGQWKLAYVCFLLEGEGAAPAE